MVVGFQGGPVFTMYRIVREYEKEQTFGKFQQLLDKRIVFEVDTLELPWKDNQRNISCIPEGEYLVRMVRFSKSFPYPHYEVLNVPDRSGIKIHRVNFVKDLRGCIGPGLGRVDIDMDGLSDVVRSTMALNSMIERLPKEFMLNIT